MKLDDFRGGRNESLEALADQLTRIPPDSFYALLLRELMDSIEESVILLDRDLRVIGANRHASALFGYSSREFLTRTLSSLLEEGERQRMLENVRSASERRGGDAIFRTRSHRKIALRVSFSPLGLEGEKPQGYLLIGRRPQDDYKSGFSDASNGLTERMLESFADPLFVVDGSTRIVRDCNDAASVVFGFSREEIIGRRLLDHIADDEERVENEALLARAERTYATAGVFQERYSFPRRSLPPLLCDCLGLPVFKPDGSLDTIIVMLFDRSIEEDNEAELRRFIERVAAFADEVTVAGKRHATAGRVRFLSDLGFTPRQIEIARFVAQGATSKDIGFRLGIVESTVKHHLSAIFHRLGVASRIEFIHKLSAQRLRIG